MSNLEYYLLWLAGGLVLIAIASALIARQLRLGAMRRLQAAALLAALSRYSEWVAAQRRSLLFQGDGQDDTSALAEVRDIAQQWFPDLAGPAAQVFAVHAKLVEFLSSQQTLRIDDPEAWLESDHDLRFVEQWRDHAVAVQRLAGELRLVCEPVPAGAEPHRTFPA